MGRRFGGGDGVAFLLSRRLLTGVVKSAKLVVARELEMRDGLAEGQVMCARFRTRVIMREGSRAMIAELDCRTWECADCGPKLVAWWGNRFQQLARMGTQFGVNVCRVKKELRSLLVKLRRAGRQYISALTDAGWSVFHQAFRGTASRLDSAQLVAAWEAVLPQLKSGGEARCMTSSRRIPAGDEEPEWQVIGRTTLSLDEINHRLRDAGHQRVVTMGQSFPASLARRILE